ncbi:hypothetical protein [Agromyces marinus]|uniref:hypothetical protein n=1 Tax=Agromyces marinus TaxID=1389020 RepID=UPI001F1E7BFF|nr:hypothetical protein [Agromyces marinus]
MGVGLAVALVGGILLALTVGLLLGSEAAADPGGLGSMLRVDAGAFIGLAVKLAGFLVGGELQAGIGSSGSAFVSAAGSASLWAFPLTLTAAVVAASAWWGIRQQRRNALAVWWHRAAYGVAVGLVASVLLLIAVALAAPRFGTTGESHVYLATGGARLVIVGMLVIGGSAWLGREVGRGVSGGTLFEAVRHCWANLPRIPREALGYAAFGFIGFAPIALILTAVQAGEEAGPAAALAAFVFLPNLAAAVGVLAQLGGLTFGASVNDVATVSETASVFNSESAWLWLSLLVAVAVSLVAAVWIGTRRTRRTGAPVIDWRSAWRLPAVVTAAWIVFGLLLFGASAAANGTVWLLSGRGAAALSMAWWSPLVLLLWAAAVEMGAQTLPALIFRVSPRVLSVIAGRRAAKTWADGSSPIDVGGAEAGVEGADAVGADAIDVGGDAADAVGAEARDDLDAPRPLSPEAKKRVIVAAAGVGGLVLIGVASAITVSVVNATVRSPEAIVTEYVGHIAAGRAEAANALVDPNVPNADREFLTDDVLMSATDRISDVDARLVAAGGAAGAYGADGGASAYGADRGAGDRFVEATFKLDGVDQSATLRVEQLDNEWLVLDRWRITTSLATEAVVGVNGMGGAQVAGLDVPLVDAQFGAAEGTVVLYPGIYEVAPTSSPFSEAEPARLAVVPSGVDVAYVQVEYAPTEALRDAVQEELTAQIDACASRTEARPDGCPFSVFVYPSDTPVAWEIVEYPTIEIDEDGLGYRARGGEATATYTSSGFGSQAERTTAEEFTAAGQVTVDGDAVDITMERGFFW